MNAMMQDLEAKLTCAVRGLDITQTQIALSHKWNIQQIVEHLNLSYASTEALIQTRLAKGRPTQAKPAIAQHCKRLLVAGVGYFPHGLTAPEAVTPPETSNPMSGEEVGLRFSERLRTMDCVLAEASSLFGETKPVASHLFLGPLSIAQWRRFHVIHGLHHLKQIDALRQSAGNLAALTRPAADPPHRL